jgi:hypothetical protein
MVSYRSKLRQVGRKKESRKKYRGAKLLLPLSLHVQGKKENNAL